MPILRVIFAPGQPEQAPCSRTLTVLSSQLIQAPRRRHALQVRPDGIDHVSNLLLEGFFSVLSTTALIAHRDFPGNSSFVCRRSCPLDYVFLS